MHEHLCRLWLPSQNQAMPDPELGMEKDWAASHAAMPSGIGPCNAAELLVLQSMNAVHALQNKLYPNSLVVKPPRLHLGRLLPPLSLLHSCSRERGLEPASANTPTAPSSQVQIPNSVHGLSCIWHCWTR